MNDDTFVESSFRFFLNNWFDVMLVFAFLLLLLSFVYINKAKAAHGDPTLFENKVKDQLYHRTIVLKPVMALKVLETDESIPPDIPITRDSALLGILFT